MAAGKAPPTATPTVSTTEPEEDVLEEFPVIFSAPPSTAMADVHRPQVRIQYYYRYMYILICLTILRLLWTLLIKGLLKDGKFFKKKEALFPLSLYSTLFK